MQCAVQILAVVCIRYAMSGNGLGYSLYDVQYWPRPFAVRCPVMAWAMLCIRHAMSGTDLGSSP
eukprot:1683609-Rhodomonas_salina.1